ncbi:flavoprotein [Streptomyces sp. H27-C3]|uniref:flavoprotein n=1 Tax=Streptomyces sp. H27-C3 TaxID=3046305 RepID=UPI0024B886EE|nr:flavoprotein [Streptomyces sp. H27-C3]MDJ0463445.1 flavoprotein [Streptomyces sp. H27-C3]
MATFVMAVVEGWGAVTYVAQRVLAVVGCAADGVEQLRSGLVEPAMERGWQVAVTLTPTAGRWLRETAEFKRLEKLTGLPVRDEPRLPSEARPHPYANRFVVAPATANTTAKLACGFADNQALTQVSEAIGTLDVPVILFPRVNAAHARHPAWNSHITALRRAGVHLIHGPDVWPLHEPRRAPADQQTPWPAILAALDTAT